MTKINISVPDSLGPFSLDVRVFPCKNDVVIPFSLDCVPGDIVRFEVVPVYCNVSDSK